MRKVRLRQESSGWKGGMVMSSFPQLSSRFHVAGSNCGKWIKGNLRWDTRMGWRILQWEDEQRMATKCQVKANNVSCCCIGEGRGQESWVLRPDGAMLQEAGKQQHHQQQQQHRPETGWDPRSSSNSNGKSNASNRNMQMGKAHTCVLCCVEIAFKKLKEKRMQQFAIVKLSGEVWVKRKSLQPPDFPPAIPFRRLSASVFMTFPGNLSEFRSHSRSRDLMGGWGHWKAGELVKYNDSNLMR